MALVLDTGPLYASLDRADDDHAACRRLIETADEPLVIPAPVLVEIDYLVRTRMHSGVLVSLLDDILQNSYLVYELLTEDYQRARAICDRYADAAVGFVDAAVLATVESLNETKLATLDHRHFRMMQPRHVNSLTLLPE